MKEDDDYDYDLPRAPLGIRKTISLGNHVNRSHRSTGPIAVPSVAPYS